MDAPASLSHRHLTCLLSGRAGVSPQVATSSKAPSPTSWERGATHGADDDAWVSVGKSVKAPSPTRWERVGEGVVAKTRAPCTHLLPSPLHVMLSKLSRFRIE